MNNSGDKNSEIVSDQFEEGKHHHPQDASGDDDEISEMFIVCSTEVHV